MLRSSAQSNSVGHNLLFEKLLKLLQLFLVNVGNRERPSSSSPSPQVTLYLLTHSSRQIFLESSAGAGQPRHNRTRRNLRDVGYFLVGETFLVSQRQDFTEFRRQCIHR